MAENVKTLRRRLRSIRNTKQITRAMEMVSAAKLRRAQAVLEAGRPYADKLKELMLRLGSSGSISHPLIERREVKTRWLVLVTADRGLAGAFNAQIIKQAEHLLHKSEVPTALVCIGKKGYDYFRAKKVPLLWSVTDLGGRLIAQRIEQIGAFLREGFLSGQTDEIVFLYNKFISTLVYKPQLEIFLPVGVLTSAEGANEPAPRANREYLLEPTADDLLAALLPRYLNNRIYIMLAETFTAEHSARMVAMSGATRNCDELTDKLTLKMNKARQAAITKEIIEIVSGAEALKS